MAAAQAPGFVLGALQTLATLDPVWAKQLATKVATTTPAAVWAHVDVLLAVDTRWAEGLLRQAVNVSPYDAIPAGSAYNPTTTFAIDPLPFSWYLLLPTHNHTRRPRMLPACRTAGEPFALPQFALTRSDSETFMDELRGCHTAFRACFARQEPRDQFFNS